MIRTNRVAVAGALTAVVMPGALLFCTPAAHAAAAPAADSVWPVNKAQVEYLERIQLEDRQNKAQVEYHERNQQDDSRNKARIEHDEQLLEQSTPSHDIAATSEEFPWATVSLAALGLAAATGGVIVLRHERAVSRSARPVASDRAEASRQPPAHVDG